MGRRVGDSVECGNHGLRFGGSGACVEAQRRDMGRLTDFPDYKPIILKADAAGVMARRTKKTKLHAEKACIIVTTQVASE